MKKFVTRLALLTVTAVALTACLGGGNTDRQTLLSGGSWPGVSVDGDTIYMAYQTQVYAINDIGRTVWSFPRETERGQTFFAAPTVTDELVIVGDYTDSLFAIDKETGTEAWSFTSLDRGRFINSASAVDGAVYVADAAGYLYKLDLETGDLIWDFQAERDIWTVPIVENGAVYVTSLDRHVYAVDANEGTMLWQFPDADDPSEEIDIGAMAATPVFYEGVLYLSTLDKLFIALDVETQDVLWEFEGLENWVFSQPTIVEEEGIVIAGDLNGNVFALDLQSGEEAWRFETGGPVVGAPLLGDGDDVVYIASEDANVYTLDVATGEPVAAPAEVETEFTARFLFFSTGTETRPAPVYASPVAFNDLLLFGLHQGNYPLRAYAQDSLLPRWSFEPQQ
jgi:outer membrane protein assembly factor BamB